MNDFLGHSPADLLGEPIALAVLGAIALLVGLWLLLRTIESRTGLRSSSRVVASDTGQNRVRHLWNHKLALNGQPDFILEERRGFMRAKRLVAVEAKPTRRGSTLHESDEMQLVVYMLLMQAEYGARAADYGYVRYRDHTFTVELTDERARRCLEYADGVRKARRANDVDRSHDHAGRCRACSVRSRCDQALA